MASNYEHLVEVYKITEYKNGCVYKTQKLHKKWAPLDAVAPDGYMYASISTHDPDSNLWPRRIKK